MLNEDIGDDTDLSNYSEMSAESDCKLSDDKQSLGDCQISDSEGDTSHGNQAMRIKARLSMADFFTCSIATVIE